jgi:hypothetical protein
MGERLGDVVMKCTDLCMAVDGRVLFDNLNVQFASGAIIGDPSAHATARVCGRTHSGRM